MTYEKWIEVPFSSTYFLGKTAWVCGKLIALQPNKNGWMIFNQDSLFPKLKTSFGDLTNLTSLNGSLAMSGNGVSLAYYPTAGWCLRTDGQFKAPFFYYDELTDEEVGDTWYTLSSSLYSPERIVSRIDDGEDPEVKFRPRGVGADDLLEITGKWEWARLCKNDGMEDEPLGQYTKPVSGWGGASKIYIGDAKWHSAKYGECCVAVNGKECGVARKYADGIWIIGIPESDEWYECYEDLASGEKGDYVTFVGRSINEDAHVPHISWTCLGRDWGGTKTSTLVADTARWI